MDNFNLEPPNLSQELVESFKPEIDATSDNIKNKEFTKEQSEQLHYLFGKKPDESITIEDMNKLISYLGNMVGTIEQMLTNYRAIYKMGDSEFKALYDFNMEHREERPEDVSEEKYDRFNGLDKLTEEDVVKIFGKDSPIIEPEHTKTIDNIKKVVDTFISFLTGQQQYNLVYNNYTQLIEDNENDRMNELKEMAEKETNEDTKAKMLKAYNEYYAIKYLDFLKEPMEPKVVEIISGNFVRADKIKYWITRGTERLEQMKFSTKFILELSKFETRFLDPKYKEQDNILLMWFLHKLIYSDLNSDSSKDKAALVSFMITMDRLIRNQWKDDIKERIMNNIIELEEQFLEPVAKVLSESKEYQEKLKAEKEKQQQTEETKAE